MIIALIGNSKVGKSETINIVYQLMLYNGYAQVPAQFRALGNKKHRDFVDILEFNGLKVGIFSMGDYDSILHDHDTLKTDYVEELIIDLQSKQCDKVICACNDNLSAALVFIKSFTNTIVQKTLARSLSDERIANSKDAKFIYNLI